MHEDSANTADSENDRSPTGSKSVGQSATPARYAVVVCPECHGNWIVEDHRVNEQVQCPHCGHRRSPDRLKVRAEHDDIEVVRELRARIEAAEAGALEEYKNEPDWGEMEDEVKSWAEQHDGLYADRIDEWRERFDALFAERAEEHLRYLEGRWSDRARDAMAEFNEVFAGDVDLDDEPCAVEQGAGDGQVIPTNQAPVDAEVSIEINGDSGADVWYSVVNAEGFERALTDSVRDIVSGGGSTRPAALREAGVTAANGGYATVVAALDQARESNAHQEALEVTAQFGQDGQSILGPLGLEDATAGPVSVLAAADRTPTIAVRLPSEFQDRRRRDRERVLRVLSILGQSCDVRIVTGRVTARWLASEHRDELPNSFSDRAIAGQRPDEPTDELVGAALDDLDPDGRHVEVLRNLSDEPAETLSLEEIRSRHDVSDGRISQILGDLEELNLIERYGTRTDKRVELLKPGSALLDTIAEEFGFQATLQSQFSEAGQSPSKCRVTRAHEREGTARYRTRFLGRAHHMAAAGICTDNAVTAVDTPELEDEDADRHTRYVSHNGDRDEAVLSVRASGPMQYITSSALALASEEFMDATLPVDRLDEVDEPPDILRDARNIGGLSSEAVEDPKVLRENLIEWGETLSSMTTDLHNGAYEDRNRFRGEILRSAHGLAGTIVHLLDVVGVDVVREIRLPRDVPDVSLAALSKTISIATAIQSKYGAFTIYRQLFEDRTKKREASLTPDVDAEDPYGEYIGGLVLRGPKATRLAQHLEGTLRSPAPLHDDAPEIAVRISVQTVDRSDYAETITRMLSMKNLKPTREAVTLFRAFVGNPFVVAEAIQLLGEQDYPQEMRIDEVRRALAALEPNQIFPEAPPSVSAAVWALLRNHWLSRAELLEEAGISERSLRRHADILEAFDLVIVEGGRYRINLPSNDVEHDERGQRILPEPVDDSHAAVQDPLLDATIALLDDLDRLSDPDDPVGDAITWPYDFGLLLEAIPELSPWLSIAWRLCGDDPPTEADVVRMGPEPKQASVRSPRGSDGVKA